jgi:hypothetical protein
MAEMILPGTYIEVRAEGLIAAGAISVSNLGIVGTARRGPLNKVMTPSNISEAREIFGLPDAFDNPEETTELTLVRALELAYGNGAQRVFAVRVAQGEGTAPGADAVFTLATDASDGGNPVTVPIHSAGPGSGYNDAE